MRAVFPVVFVILLLASLPGVLAQDGAVTGVREQSLGNLASLLPAAADCFLLPCSLFQSICSCCSLPCCCLPCCPQCCPCCGVCQCVPGLFSSCVKMFTGLMAGSR